eukprot:2031031-Prymnesium_polylepis.1
MAARGVGVWAAPLNLARATERSRKPYSRNTQGRANAIRRPECARAMERTGYAQPRGGITTPGLQLAEGGLAEAAQLATLSAGWHARMHPGASPHTRLLPLSLCVCVTGLRGRRTRTGTRAGTRKRRN